MFMQNFGGKTKSIMVFLKVAYYLHGYQEPPLTSTVDIHSQSVYGPIAT